MEEGAEGPAACRRLREGRWPLTPTTSPSYILPPPLPPLLCLLHVWLRRGGVGGREGNEELRGRHHPKEFSRRISRGNSRIKMAWRGKKPLSSICPIIKAKQASI